jgi:putative ABC transport system permease protein
MYNIKIGHLINYLKRNKLTSAVNIFGLTVGISLFLLLTLYTKYETSYDTSNKNAERVYSLIRYDQPVDGEAFVWRVLPPPLKPLIESRIPDIESVSRLYQSQEEVFKYKDNVYEEEMAFYADQAIIDILDIELIEKSQDEPLASASSIIISESVAKRYFGNEHALGKTISLHWGDLQVTAVYKDLTKNRHVRPELIIAFDSPWWIKVHNENNWDLCFLNYYVKTNQVASPELLARKITNIYNEGVDAVKRTNKEHIELQAICDIHLGGIVAREKNAGDIRIINAIRGISYLILLIVLINFTNLASAQILERSSQVCIRKVLGISKFGIIKSFTAEVGIIQFSSLIIAFCIVKLLMPLVNVFLDVELSFALFSLNNWLLFAFIILLSISVSVLYPVLSMRSFEPVSSLKGKFVPSTKGAVIRKVLIGFQFFISFALIFGTLVFYRQSQYLINKDIGIDTHNMLIIKTSQADWNSFGAKKELFKSEMKTSPLVHSITNSNAIPGFRSFVDWISTTKQDSENTAYFSLFDTDHDFIQTMGLKIIAGHALSKKYGNHENSAVISREGLDELGFTSPEEAIGKEVIRDFLKRKYVIVGVVEDFKISNLGKKPYPPFISIMENQNRFLSIRYQSENETELVKLAEEKWKIAFGDLPFRYFFLDENYRAVYSNEVFQTKIISILSIIAVILAALGLFGMTHFTVLKREKEFTIRKINGAIISDVFLLVAKGFIVLITIASLFALPLSWWLSNGWLNKYAVRIDISWWYYFIPMGILVLVTIVTISYHTLKAAWVNPANILRNE